MKELQVYILCSQDDFFFKSVRFVDCIIIIFLLNNGYSLKLERNMINIKNYNKYITHSS